MKKIAIFGKNHAIVEQESKRDSIRVVNNRIIIKTHERSPEDLLKEFLAERLYSELIKIYEQIRKEGKFEIFGDLDFEIVEKIDNKKQRIAKQKGNKILVKLNAVVLPKSALRYVIAHKIAHIFTKRHTKKFWKIVRTIYPNFEVGQNLLEKHKEFLLDSPFVRIQDTSKLT